MTGSRAEAPRVRGRAAFPIAGETVAAGRKATLEVPIGLLATGTGLTLPLSVLHGRRPGPVVWLSGAIHGDELNGVEVVRRTVASLDPRMMAGTVLAVPVVNVFGFLAGSRYLPDRRDLNRSFPGSDRGSLASRLAALFMKTVVERCVVGIDLHTGTDHRTNLPQVRADLDDPQTRRLAEAFGAPVAVHARLRDGSLREAAAARGIRVLLFEGGEAHRFDTAAIEVGVTGVRRVLAALGIVADPVAELPAPVEIRESSWIRARRGGVLNLSVGLGERVVADQVIGQIGDTLDGRPTSVKAPAAGIVIGLTRNPLVNRGDALIHVGKPSRPGRGIPEEDDV